MAQTVFGHVTQGIFQNKAIATNFWLLHPFLYYEPADQVWKSYSYHTSLKDVAQTVFGNVIPGIFHNEAIVTYNRKKYAEH